MVRETDRKSMAKGRINIFRQKRNVATEANWNSIAAKRREFTQKNKNRGNNSTVRDGSLTDTENNKTLKEMVCEGLNREVSGEMADNSLKTK